MGVSTTRETTTRLPSGVRVTPTVPEYIFLGMISTPNTLLGKGLIGNTPTGGAMTSHDTPQMKDISHTPPEGEPVTNVWLRGGVSKPADTTNETPTPADD